MFEILNIPIGMFRILNVPWANWNSYLEGGGLQGEEIVKSTLFCKVHYVLNSDIKFVGFLSGRKHSKMFGQQEAFYFTA
jgi:hypothetical protein